MRPLIINNLYKKKASGIIDLADARIDCVKSILTLNQIRLNTLTGHKNQTKIKNKKKS